MINSYLGLAETGIYSIGYRFGMIIMLVDQAFGRAWMPYFFQKINTIDYKDKMDIVKATYFYFTALTVAVIGYLFLIKLLFPLLIGEKFQRSQGVILLICVAYIIDGLWRHFNLYLINLSKTKLYSMIVFIAGFSNVTANYFLIPAFEIQGAALATALSMFIGAFLTIYFSLKSQKMPWLLAKKNMEGI